MVSLHRSTVSSERTRLSNLSQPERDFFLSGLVGGNRMKEIDLINLRADLQEQAFSLLDQGKDKEAGGRTQKF